MADAELIHTLLTIVKIHRSAIQARWDASVDDTWDSEAYPHVSREFYTRWVFLLFRISIRHLRYPESRRLESFIRQSVEDDMFGRISIDDLLEGITGLITLKWITIEVLNCEKHWSVEYMQHVTTLIEQAIVQTRTLIIKCYVEKKEHLLHRHERYLDSIISGSADAITIVGDDKIIRSWNWGAQIIYGYTADEAIGQPVSLLIPPELQAQGEDDQILEELRQKGFIQKYETIRQTKDGRRINVELTATQLVDDQGIPRGLNSVIIRDITERKELELRLERKIHGLSIVNEIGRALQRTITLDEILYIVLVGVTAGQALKFNRAFLFLVNAEQTHLEGRMAIGPSSPEEADRIWTDLVDKRLTLNDILQSYRKETAPQDTRINKIIREISVPLEDTSNILVHAHTSRASFNIAEADRHPDVPREILDLIGSQAFAIVPLVSQEQAFGVLLVDNLITGQPIGDEDMELFEIFAQQASATIENIYLYQELEQQVRALEEANNNLKMYQEKMIHSDRLAVIGEMSATVAHEIRNPLVSIGGFARSLRRQIPPGSPMRESLEIIIKEGMRLEKIVTELLDLARPISVPKDLHDIVPLIRESLQIIDRDLRTKQIRVEDLFPADLPHVPLDKDQIKQVFLNLFKNAIEATPQRGNITIWTSIPNPAYIEIGITDTGAGIAPELLDQVFSPFFTTKPGGAGLGLAVASRIVRDHGGTLNVNSTTGEGTTFLIHLPVNQPESSTSADRVNNTSLDTITSR